MPLTHRHLMVEGHRIAYVDEGAGDPVMLLHGIPTSSQLWREIVPVLAKRHRVIAPDMLNYGESDKPARADVSIAAQARIMTGVLDALGIARTDLVAHDIGGGVAQIMALRQPARFDRLVLASAVCFDSWPIPEFLPLQDPKAEAAMDLASFTEMLRGFLPNGVVHKGSLTEAEIDMVMKPWSGEAGKAALFRNFRRLNPEYTMAIAKELETLPHETLILWGRNDPFQKPAYAEKLAAAIPNAKLIWIEDAAHWIQEEKPAEVAAHLMKFLDRPKAA